MNSKVEGAKHKISRAEYAWYLHPPFDKKFDRSHWWKAETDHEPMAALYELVRRHPFVEVGRRVCWGKRKLKGRWERMLDRLHCLTIIGLKSWPKLSPQEQELWRTHAGNMKGLDSRKAEDQCCSLIWPAISQIALKRFTAHLSQNKASKGEPGLFEKCITERPPSPRELELAILREAKNKHRQGYMLMAIAPDLTIEKASPLMALRYGQYQDAHKTVVQRARHESWLPIIADYEQAELDRPKGHAQAFKRYQAVMERMQF